MVHTPRPLPRGSGRAGPLSPLAQIVPDTYFTRNEIYFSAQSNGAMPEIFADNFYFMIVRIVFRSDSWWWWDTSMYQRQHDSVSTGELMPERGGCICMF